jgi:hypothetical protein
VAGALLIGASLATSASAATLRRGSTGSGGATIVPGGPGAVLWTWYDTSESDSEDNVSGHGDNIIRLINPVGSANGFVSGSPSPNACAMIYVFDDDEEMGECCGCPITPVQMATISVQEELTANWGIFGGDEPTGISDSGAIAIVASAINNPGCAAPGGSPACNGGCDPSAANGGSLPGDNNLLGSITHNQSVTGSGATGFTTTSGLTEVALFDDGGGDPANLSYLQVQCGAMVGNASGGGICECFDE